MDFKEFKKLVDCEYIPSMYEVYNNENVIPSKRSYCYSGVELYYEVFKLIQPYISSNSSFMDIGSYPGTFLRILQLIYKGQNIELFGSGLVCEDNEVEKYNENSELNPHTKCIRTNDKFEDFMRNNEKINFIDLDLEHDYSNSNIFGQNDLDPIKTFDFVTCMECIEHLHSPYNLFNLINRMTKKNGFCVVETNNIAYWPGIYKLLVGGSNLDMELVDKYELNNPTIKRPHTRFYSLDEINMLFKKAGFRVTKSYAYNWGTPPSILKGKKKFLQQLKRVNFIDQFKSHIIVLAQKL